MWLVLICCVMAGVLGGVLGIGGGAILIPVLTLIGGFSWHEAYSISLFSIISSSLWVSYKKIKKDLVHFEWALFIEAFGCGWALLGSGVAILTSGAFANEMLLTLSTFFAIHILVRSVKSAVVAHRGRSNELISSLETAPVVEMTSTSSSSLGTKIGLSSACGFLSGLLGIGGGVVVVACSPFMKISMHMATATSSYAMGSMTMGALFGTVVSGKMVWEMGLIAFVGTVCGSVMGVQLAQRVSELELKLIFAVLLVGYTIYMWYQYGVVHSLAKPQ